MSRLATQIKSNLEVTQVIKDQSAFNLIQI